VYGTEGITLLTSSIRRNPPQCIDSKIHHNNLINNILAKIEANEAGADDAIMLDIYGFVSETNATNIFLIKAGALHTPLTESCLPGLTRAKVLEIARENKTIAVERHITLSECYTADEVFTTGTMGGLSPVIKIDGRIIGDGQTGPMTSKLRNLYLERVEEEAVPVE
jgi:branched-subunit amino acid aminotransferase/4-amino-4-deoxychorismate lyase